MHTVIALEGPSARSVSQGGLVVPSKIRDEVRRAFKGNPFRAWRFWPSAALLVGHDEQASLPPRALLWAKIGYRHGVHFWPKLSLKWRRR
jgi:hypothetical protein